MIDEIRKQLETNKFLTLDELGNIFIEREDEEDLIFDKKNLNNEEQETLFCLIKNFIKKNKEKFSLGKTVHENNFIDKYKKARADLAILSRSWWSQYILVNKMNFRKKIDSTGLIVYMNKETFYEIDISGTPIIINEDNNFIHPNFFNEEKYSNLKNILLGVCKVRNCYNDYGEVTNYFIEYNCHFHSIYPNYIYNINEDIGLDIILEIHENLNKFELNISKKIAKINNSEELNPKLLCEEIFRKNLNSIESHNFYKYIKIWKEKNWESSQNYRKEDIAIVNEAIKNSYINLEMINNNKRNKLFLWIKKKLNKAIYKRNIKKWYEFPLDSNYQKIINSNNSNYLIEFFYSSIEFFYDIFINYLIRIFHFFYSLFLFLISNLFN